MTPLSEAVIKYFELVVKHIAVVISPGQHLTIGSPFIASYIVTVLEVLLEITMVAVGSNYVRN